MNKWVRLLTACIVPVVLGACDDDSSVSGVWVGTCKNTTFGGKADIELVLEQNGNRLISGYLSIKGNELGGSGPIKGFINGDTITFNTPGDGETAAGIQWEGKINSSKSMIVGSYTVTNKMILHPILGATQQGVFQVRR